MLLRVLSIPKLMAPSGHLGRICFPKRNFAAKQPPKKPAKPIKRGDAAKKEPFRPYTFKDLSRLFTVKRILKNYGTLPLFVVIIVSSICKICFYVYAAISKDDTRWTRGSIPISEREPEDLDNPWIRKLVVFNDKYMVPEPMRKIYEDKVFDPNEKWT